MTLPQYGGPPLNLDLLRANLRAGNKPNDTHMAFTLFARDVIAFIFDRAKRENQANRGNVNCARFLAELLALLSKNRSQLEASSQTFHDTWSKWKSAHTATMKGSALRRIIHDIIRKTEEVRIANRFPKSPGMSEIRRANKRLARLPDLSASSEVVDQWVDEVVYPRLRKMKQSLAEHPEIGKLKKARDENGKFQLSRLKPLIYKTTARIAALPQSHFFAIS